MAFRFASRKIQQTIRGPKKSKNRRNRWVIFVFCGGSPLVYLNMCKSVTLCQVACFVLVKFLNIIKSHFRLLCDLPAYCTPYVQCLRGGIRMVTRSTRFAILECFVCRLHITTVPISSTVRTADSLDM